MLWEKEKKKQTKLYVSVGPPLPLNTPLISETVHF